MTSPSRRGSAAVALTTLLLSLSGSAAGDEAPGCRRVPLDPAPRWSPSAAWRADGQEIGVVDVASGRILRFSESGGFLGAFPGVGQHDAAVAKPVHLDAVGDGFVVEEPPGRLLWVDAAYRPLKALDFRQVAPPASQAGEVVPFGLKSYRLVAGDLVGLAILHRGGKPWLGWLRASLEPFRIVELLDEVEPDSLEDRLFRLGADDVAASGAATYALRWRERGTIVELTPVRRRLAAFPPGYDKLPFLPDTGGGPSAGPTLYRALERSTMAVELHGRGDFLYLSTREPEGEGTRWRLWKIDPRRDALVGSVVLPTSASHLVVAPGSRQWAFVEKGQVTAPGVQATRSMVLVPSPWIEEPAGSPLAGERAAVCKGPVVP